MNMTPKEARDQFRKKRQKIRHEARAFRRKEAREWIEYLKQSTLKFPVRLYRESPRWVSSKEHLFWLRNPERLALMHECKDSGWILEWKKPFFREEYVELSPIPRIKVG